MQRRAGVRSVPGNRPVSALTLLGLLSSWMFVIFFLLYLFRGPVRAEVSGYADVTYTRTDSTNRVGPDTTHLKADDLRQQYYLLFRRDLYPFLMFTASGKFDKENTNLKTDGDKTDTTITDIRPYVDLTLNNGLVITSVNYNKRDLTTSTTGAPTFELLRNEYNATFTYKPEGLPYIDTRFQKSDTHDKDRTSIDTEETLFFGRFYYEPFKGATVEYRPTYIQDNDKVNLVDTTQVLHNARATYSGQFFNNRVSVTSSVNYTRAETDVTRAGKGEVQFPVFARQGLSALNDNVQEVTLDPNAALIDGNTVASASINIGLPPLGGDNRLRNMGLDFFADTEVNTLFVWVDRELPPEIANSFTWDVYTSGDNLSWSAVATGLRAPFGPFQNMFEVRFNTVKKRFLKVVVRPLQRVVANAQNFPEIFVTELQAFVSKASEDVKGKTVQSSTNYDIYARTRILDSPLLFYDLTYSSFGNGSSKRTVLSNGLFAIHRFSSVISGTAKVAREDTDDPTGKGVDYTYSVSLNAIPLNTLQHTLNISGLFQTVGTTSTSRHSIYLNNIAQLYRGISANLGGGFALRKIETGGQETSPSVNFAVTLVPHSTLTVNLSYTGTWTKSTGTPQESTTTDTRADVTVSYNPFPSLYLNAEIGRADQLGKRLTTRNYGVSWSPFPDGAVQFNFTFTQDIQVETNSFIRVIRPSLRWFITRRTWIELSYQTTRNEQQDSVLNEKLATARLRMNL